MRQPTSAGGVTATAGAARDGALPPSPPWLFAALATLLTPERMELLRAERSGHPWDLAVQRGWTTNAAVLAALGAQLRLEVADLTRSSPAAVDAIPEAMARRYRIVPLALSKTVVDIATSDPHDLDCERAIAFALGRRVRMSLAAPAAVAARLDELYRAPRGGAAPTPLSSPDGPIIRLVDEIVGKAIQHRSSDVHLEPEEHGVVVRYRIDGVLTEDSVIPRALAAPLVVRIKILARLDIADRLRPQDGRARVAVGGTGIDLRISTLPASLGEKIVIRILDTRQTVLALDALGLAPADIARIRVLAQAREGLVCVTGPTGSGKTTTLYSMLPVIQSRGVNLVTVEDPVEYRLAGVVQVQVNDKTGLSFPAALRSILRQDPDVILIGEVRDRETAQIAVQASLTGHLVLTTLHTIDAASAVTRLADLGVESYKVAAALKGIVAQRLVRRLCRSCRAPAADIPAVVGDALPVGARVYAAVGCDACAHTGYRGRLAASEVLISTAEVERRIISNAPPVHIFEAARVAGMRSMWESGLDHVQRGLTSVDEMLRVFEHPVSPERESAPVRAPQLPSTAAESSAPFHVAPASFGTRASPGAAFTLIGDDSRGVVAPRVVLVASGDAAVRTDMHHVLTDAGFVVHEVGDGVAALDEIDRRGPHAVVVHLTLPKLDGFAVLARLRAGASTRRLPVVALADSADEETELRAFELGATECVARPFRARVLAARLRTLLVARADDPVLATSPIVAPSAAAFGAPPP